ncbi:hypothetical protein CDL15_Pgr004729 [Punica granatum]|uniref:Uncharacterized protein n=1 Tax=Punica granatum TaxID=22663 RepID=A0A218W5U8_PUNGR|nr:hypothetical protein CDL15_Pgr004729 [Punica granatum]
MLQISPWEVVRIPFLRQQKAESFIRAAHLRASSSSSAFEDDIENTPILVLSLYTEELSALFRMLLALDMSPP